MQQGEGKGKHLRLNDSHGELIIAARLFQHNFSSPKDEAAEFD